MLVRVDYRAVPSPEEHGYLDPSKVHDLPDDTVEFLARVEPLGRFTIDRSTTPITLYFENDYD